MKVNQAVSHNGSHQRMNKEPDPEVVPKARRRRFSAQYKLDILTEAEHCTERGEIGALLRREGLYSPHLTKAGSGRSEWNAGSKTRAEAGSTSGEDRSVTAGE